MTYVKQCYYDNAGFEFCFKTWSKKGGEEGRGRRPLAIYCPCKNHDTCNYVKIARRKGSISFDGGGSTAAFSRGPVLLSPALAKVIFAASRSIDSRRAN